MAVTGFELAARAFADEGVEVCFGLMGDCNALVIAELSDAHGVRVVQARDENTALNMADGYSRVSGAVGLCLVTCGPGLTQAITALVAAVWHGSPVVVFAGDIDAARRGAHGPDRRMLVESTGAIFESVETISDIPGGIRQAFSRARTERVPVVLNVAIGAQHDVLELPPDVPVRQPTHLAPRGPQPQELSSAVEALRAARRPALIAGRGALAAGAREEVLAVGDAIGALLATTLPARDWFAGESFALGIAGGLSTPLAVELLGAADCVLAVGASLDPMTTRFGTLFPQATVVRISDDAAGVPVDVEVTADARLTLRRLLEELAGDAVRPGYRSDGVAAALLSQEPPEEADVGDGLVDPTAVVRVVGEIAPDDAILFNSIGHYWWFPMTGFGGRRPDSYVTPYEFGVMGQAFPVAIGASFATDRPLIVLEGDGGLATNLQELETVAREGVDLFMLVLNDGAYGAEVDFLERHGRSVELATYGRIDVVAVAEALGVPARRVHSAEELRAVYAEKGDGEALVVDVPIPSAFIPSRLKSIVHTR